MNYESDRLNKVIQDKGGGWKGYLLECDAASKI